MNAEQNFSFFMEQILRPIVVNAVEHVVSKTPTPPPLAPDPERFLDQKQVADIFSVSTVSIWDWERKGFLKSYRIGNLKRFKYSEVMASPKLITRKEAASHA